MMDEKQPTIYDVAKRAGVSIATVSRALSGGVVSQASRHKVELAAAELGYRQSLKPEDSGASRRAVAIVTSSVSNPYNASLLSGASEAAIRNGLLPQFYYYIDNATHCDTVVDDLLEQQPAGVLLAGFALEDGISEDIRNALTRLKEAMPLVVIGPSIEGLRCVRLSNESAVCVRKAVRHLAQLGHRRIALIGGSGGVRFSDRRTKMYYDIMREISGYAPDHYIQQTGFTAQSGVVGVNMLLNSCEPGLLPTAIFAMNDLVALGAMQQLQASGIRIPGDMSVIGCDNDFFAPYLTPPLSTVDLHPRAIGEQAMEELIVAIGGGRKYDFYTICDSSLIIRESCAAVPPGGAFFPDAPSDDTV